MTRSQLQRELTRAFDREFKPADVAFVRSGDWVRAQWRSVTVLGATRTEARSKLRSAVKDALAVRIERERSARQR